MATYKEQISGQKAGHKFKKWAKRQYNKLIRRKKKENLEIKSVGFSGYVS